MNFALVTISTLAIIASSSANPLTSGYLLRYSNQETESDESLQDAVQTLKGQMGLFAFKGILQNIILKGMAEKIESLDSRLSTVEEKIGSTKMIEVSIDKGDEVEQQQIVTTEASDAKVQKDFVIDFDNTNSNPMSKFYVSKSEYHPQQMEAQNVFNEISNEDEK